MLTKIVLEENGLMVGRNQLSTSGGGVYIDKNLAMGGTISTPNTFSYSNTTLAGNVTATGNVSLGDIVILNGLNRVIENIKVLNNSLSGNVDINVLEGGVVIYNQPSTAAWTPNFIAATDVALSSLIKINQGITVVVAARQGGTAYFANRVRVDGAFYPLFWQGGSAPTSGNTNSIDFYSYTIVKYAIDSALSPTSFFVFAAQTRFA